MSLTSDHQSFDICLQAVVVSFPSLSVTTSALSVTFLQYNSMLVILLWIQFIQRTF